MSQIPKKHPKTKFFAKLVTGFGTGRITYAIIRNNIEQDSENDKKIDKITVPAASLVLGGMAVEATDAYTDRLVDETYAWFATVRSSFKKKDKKTKQ